MFDTFPDHPVFGHRKTMPDRQRQDKMIAVKRTQNRVSFFKNTKPNVRKKPPQKILTCLNIHLESRLCTAQTQQSKDVYIFPSPFLVLLSDQRTTYMTTLSE